MSTLKVPLMRNGYEPEFLGSQFRINLPEPSLTLSDLVRISAIGTILLHLGLSTPNAYSS